MDKLAGRNIMLPANLAWWRPESICFTECLSRYFIDQFGPCAVITRNNLSFISSNF